MMPLNATQVDPYLRVAQVDPATDRRWDAFVASHPDGLVFHHSAWLRVIEESYGFKPVHLACEDGDGVLHGVLPLFRVRGLITGRGLYSLPRTPTAGPIAVDRRAASALIEEALRLIDGRHERLDIQMKSTWLDGLVDGVVGRPVVETYRLELPPGDQEIRFGNSDNHGKIKRAVNKAARNGVGVRPAETEMELRAWYALYLDTMRSHATPPRPYRFFRVCWEVLRPKGLMRLLIAERPKAGQNLMLAGSVFLMHGRTVFFAHNGRRRDALPLRPNDAIHWRAIHDAHSSGFRYFDLGEVPEGKAGLAEFKAKWGAQPTHLYLYRYPRSRRSGAETHGAMNTVRKLVDPVWKRLPLRVTAAVGDFVFSRL